jgi:hypothetical protein
MIHVCDVAVPVGFFGLVLASAALFIVYTRGSK